MTVMLGTRRSGLCKGVPMTVRLGTCKEKWTM